MTSPKTIPRSRIHKHMSRFKKEASALGARVRAFRHRAGWTLQETGDRCNLNWKHLQKVEAGSLNFTFITLVRLAVGFHKSLRSFFSGTGVPMAAVTHSKAAPAE